MSFHSLTIIFVWLLTERKSHSCLTYYKESLQNGFNFLDTEEQSFTPSPIGIPSLSIARKFVYFNVSYDFGVYV